MRVMNFTSSNSGGGGGQLCSAHASPLSTLHTLSFILSRGKGAIKLKMTGLMESYKGIISTFSIKFRFP